MTRTEKAIENHKGFMSCSAAVLNAFCEDAGLSPQAAAAAAAPMSGGKMGKCGAVLAAEQVLMLKFGANDPRIAAFEQEFAKKNQSLLCRELKGGLTGKALRSCRGCVTDAAAILEELLEKE